MFRIGNAPTGSKDPFALRRAANAIVKILAESGLPLTLSNIFKAIGGNDENREFVLGEFVEPKHLYFVWNFLQERLNFYLKDVRGFAYDVVSAVLAAGADDVRDAIARAEALTAARESADFAAISASFKRIKNILRQAEEKGFAIQAAPGVILAVEAQCRCRSCAASGQAPPAASLWRSSGPYRYATSHS
jgi:glycyl-tRNA synthetase beta chain